LESTNKRERGDFLESPLFELLPSLCGLVFSEFLLQLANDCAATHETEYCKQNNGYDDHVEHESIIAVLANWVEFHVYVAEVTNSDSTE